MTDASSKARPAKKSTAPAAQAKFIILFSDGTGNSSGKLFKTNVWRMYEAVDLGPGQPGQQRQIAYYDDGVGTSAFRPLRMLQGVFGFGLQRNVLEIYSYVCRNYDPHSTPLPDSGIEESGDHIYGFGFSRGAFTMRLVIGLIANQGVVPYTDEEELQAKVVAAWKTFRNRLPRSWDRAATWLGWKSDPKARTMATEDPVQSGSTGRRGYDPAENHHPVIRFIGVWDTVAAYGGPITEITRAIDNFFYRLSMDNYVLNPRVRRARHALALDDERDSFHPLLWDEPAEKKLREKNAKADMPWLHDERLQQVWFAGVHSDVGGGYPDESLSYVSLLWMMEEAHKSGLRTIDLVTDRYHGLANSYGPVHNSRAGLAGYYRYQPRRVDAWTHPVDNRTLGMRDPTIRGSGGQQQGLVETVRVHASVIARIASGTDGYAPIVLPADYKIVPAGGMAETKFLETSGGPALTGAQETQAKANPPPLVPPSVLDLLDEPGAKEGVATSMEQAWNIVWGRRIVYFVTVTATISLLAMPWWPLREPTRLVYGFGGALVEPLLGPDGRNAIGDVIRLPKEALPDFMGRWFEVWARNPFLFLAFALAIFLLMRFGASLERRISELSRAAWHAALPRIPPATAGQPAAGFGDHSPTAFENFRNSRGYQRAIQLFKWLILPNFVIAPLFAALVVWAVRELLT